MNKRVKFDFEIDFTNGGGIQGQEFRLDIDGDDISDKEIFIEEHKCQPDDVPL